tara:strand:- start:278 stop:427 length:150 start_codon:yes stop_codon:yes gene_type:complete
LKYGFFDVSLFLLLVVLVEGLCLDEFFLGYLVIRKLIDVWVERIEGNWI